MTEAAQSDILAGIYRRHLFQQPKRQPTMNEIPNPIPCDGCPVEDSSDE